MTRWSGRAGAWALTAGLPLAWILGLHLSPACNFHGDGPRRSDPAIVVGRPVLGLSLLVAPVMSLRAAWRSPRG